MFITMRIFRVSVSKSLLGSKRTYRIFSS